MTFNTGNPIGSTDARDLSDNAENFDKALGSLGATWKDRFGVTRDSFEGRLAKGSFYRVGTFAAGYTLTNMRQTLEYNGNEYSWAGTFPKVVAAGLDPSITPGFINRSDESLRRELNVIIKKFASVSSMINDTSLAIGNIVETIAYHDGWSTSIEKPKGGCKYEIVPSSIGVPDGGSIILLTNGLHAKALISNEVDLYVFGAKGDNSTDDYQAVQAAINYIPATGGVLKVPPAVFYLSDAPQINAKSNFIIRGIGYSGSWSNSLLGSSFRLGGSAVDGFQFSNYSYNCTVDGVHIFGGKRALHFSQCLGFHVYNCNLRANVTGIEAFGNGVGVIRDNMIRDNTDNGIYLAQSSGDTVITGNDIGGNGVNVMISTGNVHVTDNAIFSSHNSGLGCGVQIDVNQKSHDSVIRNCVISGNLIANNDIQVKIVGNSLAYPNIQDIHIHSNHIHQADDGGEGFDSGFAYGQGIFINCAKRVHIHHNNLIGLRDYAISAANCTTGVFVDHNHIRNCNLNGIVFDLVQWGRIDNNEFVSNSAKAIRFICSNTGDFTQNNRISSNSFQSNGYIFKEDDVRCRANFIYDNLGGLLSDYVVSSTLPVSQVRHISQGGNQETISNQSLLLNGAAWNGSRLILGNQQLWVDSNGRLRIKNSSPTRDTDGAIVGTQA